MCRKVPSVLTLVDFCGSCWSSEHICASGLIFRIRGAGASHTFLVLPFFRAFHKSGIGSEIRRIENETIMAYEMQRIFRNVPPIFLTVSRPFRLGADFGGPPFT